MKLYNIMVHYDTGAYNEFYMEASSEDDALDKAYLEIGYDPGEIYVEEAEND